MFFAFRVFENHLKVSRKGFWGRASVYMVLLTIVVCLFLTELSPWKSLGVVGALLSIALTCGAYRAFTDKKFIFLLFVMFILLNVQINSFLLAQATLDFHILPTLFSYENGDFLFLSAIYGSLSFVTAYFLLAQYYKRVVDEDIVLDQTKYFLWLPLLFYVIIELIYFTILKAYTNVRKEMFLPLLGLNLLALFTYYAALRSINDNFDAANEQEKLVRAESELQLWRTQYENLRSRMTADARARHDWRQHIIAIMGFAEKEDLDGLHQYLSVYKDKYFDPDTIPVCDIPTLNMLFRYYRRRAEREEITLDISTVKLEGCRISVSELTILFGNLLEYALDSCRKAGGDKKYIELKIVKDKNKMILMCGSGAGDQGKGSSSERVNSAENESRAGLLSVREIINKYNGYIKCENESSANRIYAYLQNT